MLSRHFFQTALHNTFDGCSLNEVERTTIGAYCTGARRWTALTIQTDGNTRPPRAHSHCEALSLAGFLAEGLAEPQFERRRVVMNDSFELCLVGEWVMIFKRPWKVAQFEGISTILLR